MGENRAGGTRLLPIVGESRVGSTSLGDSRSGSTRYLSTVGESTIWQYLPTTGESRVGTRFSRAG